ncbi:MAG TPA: sulfurtransferase TusA family protein [Archangium sp.]|nr:sulfurtransferase TusA family protein [Archangium sp.]
MERVASARVLEVVLRGDEPLKNVPRNAREEGHEVLALEPRGDGTHRLLLRKQGGV